MAAFEDAGFYCVDNMPVALLPIFLERYVAVNAERPGFAFVMDLREKGFLDSCKPVFTELASKKYPFEIIFLEADEKTLVRRYSQTRRQHPLASNGDLLAGVRTEKSLYAELKRDADLVVDTSAFTVHDLKSAIFEIVKKKIEDLNLKPKVQRFTFTSFYPRIYQKIVFILSFWALFLLYLNIGFIFTTLNLLIILIIFLPFFIITRNPENIKMENK